MRKRDALWLSEVQAPRDFSIPLDVLAHKVLLGGRLANHVTVAAGAHLQRGNPGPTAVFVEEVACVTRDAYVAPMEHVVEIHRLGVRRVHKARQHIAPKEMKNRESGQEKRQNDGRVSPGL
jgi:hypothetical protein